LFNSVDINNIAHFFINYNLKDLFGAKSYPTLNPSPFYGEGTNFSPLYIVERGRG